MNHYEIEACVIRAKNGSKAELLKVLEAYKPFIFKTARQFNIKGYDMYDLVQLAYVTLINAVAKYRTGSNTFSSYGCNSIRNAFRHAARDNSRCNSELSLNTPVNSETETGTEIIDLIEGTENFEEELIFREQIRELRRVVAKLPADEMNLVIMVYYSGASMKTYAEKNGLSYNQAIRKRDRILDKLRKYMDK